MLGEIFGLKAGLMSVEQELFRFFDVRASFESILLPFSMGNAGLVGVVTLSIIGLGRPDMEAPGVWSAASLGVFRAAIRGVSWSSTRTAVSSLDSAGRSNEGSGRVKSSIMGGPSRESPKFGEGWMRINEAGVAGVAGPPPWPFIWAIMAGDAVWEPGMGGGRISDSSGSGEMESVSEVSRLWGTSRLSAGRVSQWATVVHGCWHLPTAAHFSCYSAASVPSPAASWARPGSPSRRRWASGRWSCPRAWRASAGAHAGCSAH
jgi:hypothetical protein